MAFSNGCYVKTKKTVNQQKNVNILKLNLVLNEIAKINGSTGIQVVARSLNIPSRGRHARSKQISGYIGVAKNELRRLQKKRIENHRMKKEFADMIKDI